MDITSALDRLTRPLAILTLLLIGVAGGLTEVSASTDRFRDFSTVFRLALGAASVVLVALAAASPRTRRSVRAWVFPPTGIVVAFLAGNGFTAGTSQMLLALAAGLLLLAGLLAVVEKMEAEQSRPVRRL